MQRGTHRTSEQVDAEFAEALARIDAQKAALREELERIQTEGIDLAEDADLEKDLAGFLEDELLKPTPMRDVVNRYLRLAEYEPFYKTMRAQVRPASCPLQL